MELLGLLRTGDGSVFASNRAGQSLAWALSAEMMWKPGGSDELLRERRFRLQPERGFKTAQAVGDSVGGGAPRISRSQIGRVQMNIGQ